MSIGCPWFHVLHPFSFDLHLYLVLLSTSSAIHSLFLGRTSLSFLLPHICFLMLCQKSGRKRKTFYHRVLKESIQISHMPCSPKVRTPCYWTHQVVWINVLQDLSLTGIVSLAIKRWKRRDFKAICVYIWCISGVDTCTRIARLYGQIEATSDLDKPKIACRSCVGLRKENLNIACMTYQNHILLKHI